MVDVRIGVQHTFYNGTDLRFGFRRYDSYADEMAEAVQELLAASRFQGPAQPAASGSASTTGSSRSPRTTPT